VNVLVGSRAVAPLHGWGGLERAVADLCTGLTARGHAVTLVTTEPVVSREVGQSGSRKESIPSPASLDVASLVTVPWPAPRGVRRGSALDRSLTYPRVVEAACHRIAGTQHSALSTQHSYDAAIGMGAMAAAFIPLRDNGRVRRLILNPQGMEEFFGHFAKRIVLRPQQRLVRRAARHADHVIATDDYLVESVRRTLRVPPDRIAVIPNGVDVARIDAQTDHGPAVPADAFTLISVARIVPYKGLAILADALGRLRSQLPPGWRWIHVGDGQDRGALEAAIDRAGIGAHVTVTGHVPESDLHRALAAATIFVHPTLYEGSSLVTLEAMTHGLPVIASAAGGIPDKVVPGETGWLVPPGDAAALTNAIREAAESPAERLRAKGAAGRARVIARFSLSHTLDLTEALLAR
jgi:glycosyltransferase involved in cell wall biosynthesis